MLNRLFILEDDDFMIHEDDNNNDCNGRWRSCVTDVVTMSVTRVCGCVCFLLMRMQLTLLLLICNERRASGTEACDVVHSDRTWLTIEIDFQNIA